MGYDKVPIQRVLISVSDKSGLERFLQDLNPGRRGIHLISSGGTAKAIHTLGYEVTEISAFTGYAESPGGYVKTLHPRVHGGLLLNPAIPEHHAYMGENKIPPIDLLVVNLYPFQKTVEKPNISFEEAREQIDIGGPAMIRGAAKNSKRVAVLVDWEDAAHIKFDEHDAFTMPKSRAYLMKKAFAHTAAYDRAIADFLASKSDEEIAASYGGK